MWVAGTLIVCYALYKHRDIDILWKMIDLAFPSYVVVAKN